MGLKISEVGRKTGISTDAIRYYEELGLVRPAGRTPAGYRVFEADAVKRITFIKNAQTLGLTLTEIGELLKIQDEGACPCGHTKTLLEKHLEQVNTEIATLMALREDLKRLSSQECFSMPGGSDWACEIELVRKEVNQLDIECSCDCSECEGGSCNCGCC